MHVCDVYLRPHDLEQSSEALRCFSFSYTRGNKWFRQRQSSGDNEMGLLATFPARDKYVNDEVLAAIRGACVPSERTFAASDLGSRAPSGLLVMKMA